MTTALQTRREGTVERGDPMKPLGQLLVDWREDAQVLRNRGLDREADMMDRMAEECAIAAHEYIQFISEDDAMLRSDRSKEWLRARFRAWERRGHAFREGRKRYYRMLIVPCRMADAEAFEAGRKAARNVA